ncbi:flagellar hook-length control protein FliK [Endozoicomonas sp. SM1973]|uniref:Flagellar hook-length control protein FliK n=1 Tax=Spartinivicinus marinus TaxID=2994442 RepID=A0A853IDG8_9GAMM|nr:flagellar hook-length control protein FliK [Spartinivicinus marinus]MCX4028951.1 flagellar hook-length control protein FliK [Spartinivicinus marinus]NYZ65466.1 flagellar hook-length control protein FliK [Spartinivicinus marinus]
MADLIPGKPVEPTAAPKPTSNVTAGTNLQGATTTNNPQQTLVVNQVLTSVPANQKSQLLQLDQNGHYVIEAKDQAGKSWWFRSNTPWPNNSILHVSLPKSGNQLTLLREVTLPSPQQQLQNLSRILEANPQPSGRQGQVLNSLPTPHLRTSIPLGEGGNRLLPVLLGQNNQVFWLNTDQPILPGHIVNLYRTHQCIHLQSLPYQQSQWLTLNQSLQQTVAHSLPVHQVLKQLAQTIRHNQQHPNNLPKIFSDFVSQLPTIKQLTTPKELSQWLKNSGLFFEQKIANQPAVAQQSIKESQDLKGLLLQLVKLLSKTSQPLSSPGTARQSPWAQLYKAMPQPLNHQFPWLTAAVTKPNTQLELVQLLKQAVYRLQSNQLISLQPTLATPTADAPVIQQWQLEIPLFIQNQWHSIQLELQKQNDQTNSSSTEEQEILWQFQLSFDIPPIGPLYARVKLRGNKASASFWAEQQATYQVINQHIEDLQQALTKRGIQVETLTCQQGTPARQNTFIEQHLIDIKT